MASQHLIMDFIAPADYLANKTIMSQVAIDLIDITGLHLIIPPGLIVREFSNGDSFGPGISILRLLAESNLAIHTRPEISFCNLDLFSCRPFPIRRVEETCRDNLGEILIRRFSLLPRDQHVESTISRKDLAS